MEDDADDTPPPLKERKARTVPLDLFLFTIGLFLLILLLLGLGLGWNSGPAAFLQQASLPPAQQDAEEVDVGAHLSGLEMIPDGALVNMTELDMRTNFAVSDVPVVREYEFNVALAMAAPDGFYKPMILINGQSPGPLIEANIGDTIRVRVNNHMANISTSVHWHGIDQRNTTWMDGVAGVSQCSVPPGRSLTYEFQVVGERGTYWYHAHHSVEYTDGLYGPIIIHDPTELVPEVDDEKILFIGDIHHAYAGTVTDQSYLKASSEWTPDEAGVEPLPDNFLLNGQNTYDCSVISSTYPPPKGQRPRCTGGNLYNTKVQSGQTVRLRLINHSSYMSFWFSIDNHTLSIVELDGTEVEPIPADGAFINVGQRVSVIVHADQTPGNYFLRATLPQSCFVPYCPYTSAGLESIGYQVRGVLSYDNVDAAAEPIGVAGNTTNPFGVENNAMRGDLWEGCDEMPFDVPVPMRRVPAVEATPNNTHEVVFQFGQAGEVNRVFMNRTAWSPYRHTAQIWEALNQDFIPGEQGSYNNWGFRLDQQVLLIPDANEGAQIVISSKDMMEHPFHFHGHSVQIVGWGPGLYEDGSTTTWNLDNPMRRDTITIPAMQHVVVRFVADNPGIWALHCHVAWHMEAGMFVSLLERPDDLKSLVRGMDSETRDTHRVSAKMCQ